MDAEQFQQQEIYEEHAAQDRNGSLEEAGKVDRIRDIIFGSHMRDYESRFQRIEAHLAHESAAVRADMQRRLDALENFVKAEVASMANRANAEHIERINAMEKFGRDLSDNARTLDGKISQMEERIAHQLRDLREQLLEQSKTLGAEMHDRHEQLKAGLDHEATQIRAAMTGREALAEMFSEIALRLKNEFRVPGV
jgi:ABC-type transporter Mla subunit MlaD